MVGVSKETGWQQHGIRGANGMGEDRVWWVGSGYGGAGLGWSEVVWRQQLGARAEG